MLYHCWFNYKLILLDTMLGVSHIIARCINWSFNQNWLDGLTFQVSKQTNAWRRYRIKTTDTDCDSGSRVSHPLIGRSWINRNIVGCKTGSAVSCLMNMLAPCMLASALSVWMWMSNGSCCVLKPFILPCRPDGKSQRQSKEEGAGQVEHHRPANGSSCWPICKRSTQVLRLHW